MEEESAGSKAEAVVLSCIAPFLATVIMQGDLAELEPLLGILLHARGPDCIHAKQGYKLGGRDEPLLVTPTP